MSKTYFIERIKTDDLICFEILMAKKLIIELSKI